MFVALFWRRYFRDILIVVSVLGFGAMFIPLLRDSGLFLAYWPTFSIGIGLKWVLSKPAPKFWWMGLPLAVVLSSCIAAGYARQLLHLPTIVYYCCFSVTCALVFWMAVPIDRFLRSYKDRNPVRALISLGAMSYSLYLLHAIVSEVSAAFLRQFLSQRIPLFIPLVIVLTIIPIYFFYCFFEAPFIARKSSSRLRP